MGKQRTGGLVIIHRDRKHEKGAHTGALRMQREVAQAGSETKPWGTLKLEDHTREGWADQLRLGTVGACPLCGPSL